MKIRISLAIAIAMLFSSTLMFSCEKEGMEMEEGQYGTTTDSTYLRVTSAISENDSGGCFAFVFPLSITLEDGSIESFANGAEFLAFHEIWEDANPDGPEFPIISFPIDVTLDDGSSVAVVDEEMLDEMLDECEGDEDEDEDEDEDDDEDEDEDPDEDPDEDGTNG